MNSEDYLKDQKTGKRKIQIGVSPYVSSPVTIGMIRPIILLSVNGRKYFDSKGVISHEVKHIRKMDGLFRFLSFIIVAMEWYNPLAYYLFRENMAVSEMICDEAAVKDMSKAEKMNYMESKKDLEKSIVIGIMVFCFLVSSIPALVYKEPRTFTDNGDLIDREAAGIWIGITGTVIVK